MIDNIEKIKPLLNFTEEGDFYMLYVMKRKKDQPEGEKDKHQSVRTIKTYCVSNLDYLEKRYDEIKQLAEMFKARIYIHIQKQNHMDVSLDMMSALAIRIKNKQHSQQNLFDSVVGQVKTNEKRWVVDIDVLDLGVVNVVSNYINGLDPKGDKIEATIPTKNGYHLITKKFNTKQFTDVFPEHEIQKRNPTLLYYPNSLDGSL
jgi:hypothetical protein